MSHSISASTSASSSARPIVKYFRHEGMVYTVVHASDVEFLPTIPNADPVVNLQGRELRRAIWLVDRCPELAYMLKRFDMESVFLGSLQVDPKNIKLVRTENKFTLDPAVVKTWRRLENALLYLSGRLLAVVANSSEYCFPLDPYWPTPTECGYQHVWPSEQQARKAAFRSLDACRVLLARCSMAVALATSDPSETPPRWLKVLLQNDADPKWIEVFTSSTIPDLSPNLRVGAYVSPTLAEGGTKWINHVPCMVRANVPVYIHWPKQGFDQCLARYPFLRQYVPIPELIVDVPSFENRNTFRWGSLPSAVVNPIVAGPTNADPPADTDKIPHGPGQLPGESAPAFFQRREQQNRAREAKETDAMRERRLTRAQEAAAFARPVGKQRAVVYHWITVGDVDGTVPVEWFDLDYRQLVGHGRVGEIWELYPNEHKRYDPFVHEWDICVKLAPSILPRDSEDYEEADIYDELASMVPAPIPPLPFPDPWTIAQSFNTDLQVFYEGQDVKYVPMLESLAVVARKRFGLIPRVVDDPAIPYDRYSALDIVKMLGYYQSDLPDGDPLVKPLSAMIASLESEGPTPRAPGAIWDLSSTNSEYLLSHLHPVMTVVRITLNATHWYRIRYDVPDDQAAWWDLVVDSAATVLELYRRTDIRTQHDAAEFMALSAIPFHTIFVPRPGEANLTPSRTHVSLGFRPPGYVFTYDDYLVYEHRLRTLLTRPKGRAAILVGGIVWRIVLEVVPGDWITAAWTGPSKDVFDYAIRFRPPRGDDHFDDALSPHELDFICGTYKRYSADYTNTSDMSWWPRHHHWKGSSFDIGRWTPECEKWFVKRLELIRSGKATLHDSKHWRSALRRRPAPGKFNRGVEASADNFLMERARVPVVTELHR